MEFANVLRHDVLPFIFLRMIRALESRTGRENALSRLFLPRREHQFSRNTHSHATDNLAARPLPAQPCGRSEGMVSASKGVFARMYGVGYEMYEASGKRFLLVSVQVLIDQVAVDDIEVVLELCGLRRILLPLDHRGENRFQEASVDLQGRRVSLGQRLLDFLFCGGRDQFQPTHKYAHRLRGRRLDRERQHLVHKGRRNDIQQPAALFEPRIPPGFDHGMSFVLVETLANQNSFQVAAQFIHRGVQLMRIQNRFILQCGTDAIAHFLAAALKENRRWNFLAAKIFNHQLPFRAERRGKWDRKRRDAAIKQKFFLLLTGRGLHSQGRRRSHSRGEIVIDSVSSREFWSPAWRKSDGIPSDTSVGACLTEYWVIEIFSGGPDTAGVRIPFG